ncbi:hypothetical protein D9M73_195020 [compost metagenome]
MLQACLVDVAVEALPQHLVEQVGNLVAAVAAGVGDLLQVELRVEIRLLALKILLQVVGHEAQLTRRQAQSTGRRALGASGFADRLLAHQ